MHVGITLLADQMHIWTVGCFYVITFCQFLSYFVKSEVGICCGVGLFFKLFLKRDQLLCSLWFLTLAVTLANHVSNIFFINYAFNITDCGPLWRLWY